MTRDEIAATLRPLLAELLSRPVAEIIDTAAFYDDFAVDSLDEVEVEMMVEEHFDVEFFTDEAFPETVGGLIDRIEGKLERGSVRGAA